MSAREEPTSARTGAASRVGWIVAGYLAGTIPSAWVAARVSGARTVVEGASASGSEGDAHLLLAANASPIVAAAAMAGDVAKGAIVVLAAKRSGADPATTAATGVAAVTGHAFPFYARRYAGRGLAAAAGVTVATLPREMVVAGSILLAGKAAGHTGPGSTLGFAAIPVVAAVRREPRPLVAMGAGVLAVILARRLVGLRTVAARDGWTVAVVRRFLFDADHTASARSRG